jgi:hypothetical protein
VANVFYSGPEVRRSPRLRPTMELDVDLSAVSAVVDVSSADGRQQCPSNGWQSTLELPPTEPSGIRSAALRCQTRKSAECRAVRSKKPLSCTYVISFCGPHSELPVPVSSYSLVHRDRHNRPARAPVHAPAHLPSHTASPITQTPARSESARQSAPRGGWCRFVVRSAEGSLASRL